MRTVKGEYVVDYYDNGEILSKSYLLNGELHRENGYAFKGYYNNGNILSESYLLNGKLHRENGIAFKSWWSNGNINTEQYYINGKLLTKEEFDNRNNSCNAEGKIVEIDGKKYELKEVEL